MPDPIIPENIIQLSPGEIEQVRVALDTIVEQSIEAKKFLDEREFTKMAIMVSVIEHNTSVTDDAIRSKINPVQAMKAMSGMFAKMAEDMEETDGAPKEITTADVDDVLAGLTKLLGGEDTPPAES